jgi:TonB family protein
LETNVTQTFKKSVLFWALVLSLGLHSVLFIVHLQQKRAEEEQLSQTPIELSPVPPEAQAQSPTAKPPEAPKPKIKQEMAETEDAKNREVDPNARFLGEHNQKAQQQTRAKSVDDFRAKQGSGLKGGTTENMPSTGENTPKKSESEKLEMGEGGEQKPTEDKAAAGQGIKRNWKTLSLKDLGIGGDGGATAATDDRLKGVDNGERTILSTREYKYFSYYNRIKELLRQYWKPNVERKLYMLIAKGRNIGEDEMVTELVVLLNPEGNIQKISRVGSSGIEDLDQAAVEAFQKAAPFPNPPKGIIDPDGFVRIRWDFILQTQAAPRINFSSAGGIPPPPP